MVGFRSLRVDSSSGAISRLQGETKLAPNGSAFFNQHLAPQWLVNDQTNVLRGEVFKIPHLSINSH